MNKKELLDKVKSVEGLSNDEKAYLINLVNTKKKYGLVWEDKPEDVEEQLRTHLPVLKEVKERAIINDTETEKHPNHILIEGDNLHALTSLTFTHEGKIDIIYIDPPYNTGNNDFMYNDNYIDKEDSYRHSKWLAFMEKRLKIAKNLLSEDGVIFISIDDNEQAQLQLLCNEIFTESNFIGNFVWVKKKKGSHLSKTVRSMTEYVLGYSRNLSLIELFGENAYSDKQQPLVKRTNSQKVLEFPTMHIKTTLEDGYYSPKRYGKGSSSINVLEKFEVKNGKIIDQLKVEAPFVWTQKKLTEEISLGSSVNLSSKFGFNVLRHNQGEKIKRPSTLLNSSAGIGTNEDAYQELIEIFGEEGVMTYPKPVSLIKYLIKTKAFFKKNCIVLDFFAGTGTTLQASLELNEKENYYCKTIIVTNNENRIAEKVTYERNKRIIQGFENVKGIEIKGLNKNNLRYYQTELIERHTSLSNKRKLTQLSTELLCIKEDCYTEVTSKLENASWHKFFNNGIKNYVYVIYDDMFIEDGVAHLTNFISKNPKAQIKVYVFANGPYPYTEEFGAIAENIELAALPDAIYKAYQNILPKQNKEFIPELEEESPVEFDQ